MQQTSVTNRSRVLVNPLNKLGWWLSRHWLSVVVFVYGAWVLTPFLAPGLMKVGATSAADAIYLFYSFVCHQLPQRSLFFFGPRVMYSFNEIRAVWPEDGFMLLRQFIGNPEMGYKVAWSDRMISFYGSLWIGALLFALLRTRLKSLSPVVWLFVGILPVGLDGFSHMINDVLAGFSGTGFRDTNAWLQFLTGNRLPRWFYAGDALGSFNSDIRWITGFLFGLTTVWFLFPLIEDAMRGAKSDCGADQTSAECAKMRQFVH